MPTTILAMLKLWNQIATRFVDVIGQTLATGKPMLKSRIHATRVLAITGATLCLVFLLAVIVLG